MHKTTRTKQHFMIWKNIVCLIILYGISKSNRSTKVKTLLLFISFLTVSVAFCNWKIMTTCHIPEDLCQIEKQKQKTDGEIRDIKFEHDIKVQGIESQLTNVASQMILNNREILFTVINEAYIPFTYSWLCNTKPMNIHSSVLIVTTDKQSKEKLKRDWSGINVISMDIGITKEGQSYEHIGYIKIIVKRTELIQALLMANINVFVFEVDCLWLANPLSRISIDQQDDVIVNPVSGTKGKIFAGGFILLRSTCRAKMIWRKLTCFMVSLREKIESLDETAVLKSYEEESDQFYLAKLIKDRFANVSLKVLPLELYADGKWYELSELERMEMQPVIINNNWIKGEYTLENGKKVDISNDFRIQQGLKFNIFTSGEKYTVLIFRRFTSADCLLSLLLN